MVSEETRLPTRLGICWALIITLRNESTIVITNEDLGGFKIAHEIGHVLGADHHPTQNQGGNTAPFYGHITP
jgi:hypothetical protein